MAGGVFVNAEIIPLCNEPRTKNTGCSVFATGRHKLAHDSEKGAVFFSDDYLGFGRTASNISAS